MNFNDNLFIARPAKTIKIDRWSPSALETQSKVAHFWRRSYSCEVATSYKPTLGKKRIGQAFTNYYLFADTHKNDKVLRSVADHLPTGLACTFTSSILNSFRDLSGPLSGCKPNVGDKYSIFALIHRLGKLLGASCSKTVSWADVRGDKAIRISEAAAIGVVPHGPGSCFIPMTSSNRNWGQISTVLIGLLAAFDINVYTDRLVISPGTNTVILPVAQGPALLKSIYSTLRYLLQIADDGGRLADAMFYLNCGLMHTVTLWAHSDEGGMMRRLFRAVVPPQPFGYLASLDKPLSNIMLPDLLSGDYGVGKIIPTLFVDRLLLTFGALISVSDPGILADNGDIYPTTFINPETDGIRDNGVKDLIGLVLGDFADLFTRNFVNYYNMSAAGALDITNCIQTAWLSVDEDKHLDMDIVFPFYYIEPVPILYEVANRISHPAIELWQGEYGKSQTIDLFKHTVSESTGVCGDYEFCMEWKNARAAFGLWSVFSSQFNPADGLGRLEISEIASASGRGIDDTILCSGVAGANTIGALFWKLGDTCFPHPGNALTTGPVALNIKMHTTDSRDVYTSSLPINDDLHAKGRITMIISSLCGINNTKICEQRVRRKINYNAHYLDKLLLSDVHTTKQKKQITAVAFLATLMNKTVATGTKNTGLEVRRVEEVIDSTVPTMLKGTAGSAGEGSNPIAITVNPAPLEARPPAYRYTDYRAVEALQHGAERQHAITSRANTDTRGNAIDPMLGRSEQVPAGTYPDDANIDFGEMIPTVIATISPANLEAGQMSSNSITGGVNDTPPAHE